MTNSEQFLADLHSLGNEGKAASAARFFQAGKGGYGEGDTFWGVIVPAQRTVSRKYCKLLTPAEVAILLTHAVHEVRLCALMTLVLQYQKTKQEQERAQIVQIYRDALPWVNNWDLVDSSAHYILGDWCLSHGYTELIELAKSGHLWKQRVAMLSTFAFIKKDNFAPVFEIADLLLDHKHDLIHKAVGWMLREAGERNYSLEYDYLVKHYKTMPRTMLRYAIEKFDESTRQQFLKGLI